RYGIASLGQFGLSYDILIYARQLPAAIDLVRAFPEQRFVLDHLGKPAIRLAALEPWRTHLRQLAEMPNVYCKPSGLVAEAHWRRWAPSDLHPYLEVALECFGPRRCMIGSDWPVCTLAGDYLQVISVVGDFIAQLSVEDQAAILGGT